MIRLFVLLMSLTLATAHAATKPARPKTKRRAPASEARVSEAPMTEAAAPKDAAPKPELTPKPQTPPPTAAAAAPPAPAPAPATPPIPAGVVTESPFLDTFPGLKQYLYVEPPSRFYLGFGLSPLGILKDRTTFGADFFQLHYLTHRWDYQVLNASVGFTRAESSAYQSTNFTFTTSLNVRIGQTFEIGPLVGWEFVNFPNLSAFLFKSPFKTENDPFSSQGLVYGLNVSETFSWRKYLIQLSEIGFNETYSNEKSPDGWRYIFNNPNVRNQPSLIAPRWVMLLKISLLF